MKNTEFWKFTDALDKQADSKIVKDILVQFLGDGLLCYAVYDVYGNIMIYNLEFEKQFLDLKDALVNLKKEIMLMQSLKKQHHEFNLTVMTSGSEIHYEVNLKVFLVEEQPIFVMQIRDKTELVLREEELLNLNYLLAQKTEELAALKNLPIFDPETINNMINPFEFVKNNINVLSDYILESNRVIASITRHLNQISETQNEKDLNDVCEEIDSLVLLIQESDCQFIMDDYKSLISDTLNAMDKIAKTIELRK